MKTTLISSLVAVHLLLTIVPAGRAGTCPPVAAPHAVVTPNPLSLAEGRVVFSFEDQNRFEFRDNNFDFNSGLGTINDDSWLLNRARVGLQLKPTDWLTFFAQGQDSREIGSDRADIPGLLGAEGDNPFDLRQAYVEIGDGKSFPLSFKAGRQVLLYGDQRLIGPLDWNNISRTFDAAKIRWHGPDGIWVDAFTSSVVVPSQGGFDESDWDSIFSGIYAHIPTFKTQDTEIYALHLSDDNRNDDLVTLGTHWKSLPGVLGPWDYETEFAFQAGDAGGKSLRAFASYVEAGYTLGAAWKPRVGLEYSYGSGDGDPADGTTHSFQNLYPTNHLHYGLMDAFSWSNLHDAVLHLSAKPAKTVTAGMDLHFFWLADTADTWRRANAATAVRLASPAASNYAGAELDLLTSWTPCAGFTLTAGYSHFFAGSYLSDTGAGSDADFVYLMTGLKF
ncbi:MAG: alginate export family protein [Verrucomicrobiales bacterium]|nr:alginate export family protein [Verrucomicrobiales bacterium]MCP5556448.1 alginate export family protein [Verrucomicrobiaceae bacterium]